MAVYGVVLIAIALVRWSLWTYGTDTGTFAQIGANALHGFTDPPERGTHFRFHWSPILITLYPLIALTRTPLSLQILQVVLIGASALPLYGIARAYASERVAWRAASLALVYPALMAVAFAEFHEIAFYPVVALGLFWAADRRRWALFAPLALLAVTIREEACIVFAFVGVAFVFVAARAHLLRGAGVGPRGLLRGEPEAPLPLAACGALLTTLSVVTLFYYFEVLVPTLGGWHPAHFYVYSFGVGPVAVLLAILRHPANLGQLATFGRLTYVIEAFVPLALLPLRSWWTLLALPGLGLLLLASDQIAWRMGSHYSAIFAPWLLLASVAAIAGWSRERPARAPRSAWFRDPTNVALAICGIVLIAFDPMHPAHYLRPLYPTDDARRALALVPPAASVVTHDEWYTHDALRNANATVFYCPYVRYAVYASDFPGPSFHDDVEPRLAADVARGIARAVARVGRVTVYERRPPAGATEANCIRPGDFGYRR